MKTSRLPAWLDRRSSAAPRSSSLWWIVRGTVFVARRSGHDLAPIPTPLDVFEHARRRTGSTFYWRNFQVTLAEAAHRLSSGATASRSLLAAIVLRRAPARGRGHADRRHHLLPADRRVGGIAIVIIGARRAPGEPVGTAVFLAALRVLLHDRGRRAARLQGGGQGEPRPRHGLRRQRGSRSSQGAADRRAARDPQRPADRRARRVPRRGARRVLRQGRPSASAPP